MKITITLHPAPEFEYRFEVEGADWETVLREVRSHAESFDKAHDTVFGKPRLLDRLRNRVMG